jgi:Fe(3+) dicitrate transport protein
MNWQVGTNAHIEWTTSAVLGNRNSVMFDKPSNIVDAINPTTLQYANRQVDKDNFNSYTSEFRWLQYYSLFKKESILAAGLQYINNDLHRQQLGVGTTGSDYDMTLVSPFGRDLHLKTQNVAFFVENKIQFSPKFSVSPGARFEMGQSKLNGKISYYTPADIPNTIRHQFPLLGINSEYNLSQNKQFYAGWSQAYRPVVLKDIIPASVYETVDKDLKDAKGYNLELGFRGRSNNWRWDLGVFLLRYNNRLGNQAMCFTSTGPTLATQLQRVPKYLLSGVSRLVSVPVSACLHQQRYLMAAILMHWCTLVMRTLTSGATRLKAYQM